MSLNGFRWLIRPKAQRLKKEDPKARVNAAKRLLRANIKRLRFSDEARVTTNESCRRGQWVAPGQAPEPLLQEGYAPCFLLWGCIGIGYKRLIILPRTMKANDGGEKSVVAFRLTGESYIRRILQPCKNDLRGNIFQQDGARCHWKGNVVQWLAKQEIKLFNPWPARSPDLNPIEKMWSLLKARVSDRRTTNVTELEKAIRECWDEIPQAHVDNLVRGVKGCASACISQRGRLFGRRR